MITVSCKLKLELNPRTHGTERKFFSITQLYIRNGNVERKVMYSVSSCVSAWGDVFNFTLQAPLRWRVQKIYIHKLYNLNMVKNRV